MRIRLKEQSVRVVAPRELVFEVVAAAGEKIEETARGHVAVFETQWAGRTVRTVEELELTRPSRIGYRWIEGPLDDVIEEIRFAEEGSGSTLMTYTGSFRAGPGLPGAVRAFFFVRPVFNRLVTEHLEEGKRFAERRAERSRVYPRDRTGS